MLKTQIDQYDMILATEKVLDDNAPLYAANVPLKASKVLFSANVDLLAAQVAKQLVVPTGITDDKEKVRTGLEERTFIIGSACCSLATATGNGDLYKRCHFTKSDLVHFRDAELLGVCTNLTNDVTANAVALVAYGITPAVMTDYASRIASFSNIMKLPTEAIGKRATATAKIAELLPEISDFLKTRLDNDMVSMMLSQPEFYGVYTNVRAIKNTGTSTLSLTTTVLNETTNEPISGANLEIVGEGINRVSGERGYNTVINLVSGSHKITVMHPKYETQSQEFTVVAGETTELVILMKAK
jgi:Carboxypeptidase regulatory-like domain